MFSAYTQALRDRSLPEEDIRVLSKIIPDLNFDLRSAGEAFGDMKQMGLSGALPLGDVKTKAPNSDYHNHRDVPPIAARQVEVARDYLKRAARIDESSTATRRAPTGLWPQSSRGTTGAGCWSSWWARSRRCRGT